MKILKFQSVRNSVNMMNGNLQKQRSKINSPKLSLGLTSTQNRAREIEEVRQSLGRLNTKSYITPQAKTVTNEGFEFDFRRAKRFQNKQVKDKGEPSIEDKEKEEEAGDEEQKEPELPQEPYTNKSNTGLQNSPKVDQNFSRNNALTKITEINQTQESGDSRHNPDVARTFKQVN